jgi:hypothetical protein
MKKRFSTIVSIAALVTAVFASCDKDGFEGPRKPGKGVTINGVVWATTNVETPGKFAAKPQDYGGYFSRDEAQTACPDGWRVPTGTEIDSIRSTEYGETYVGGVRGYTFGLGDNVIFLPYAGVGHPEGPIFDASKEGWYNMSQEPDKTGGYLAFHFGLSSRFPELNYFGDNRISLRCVAE